MQSTSRVGLTSRDKGSEINKEVVQPPKYTTSLFKLPNFLATNSNIFKFAVIQYFFLWLDHFVWRQSIQVIRKKADQEIEIMTREQNCKAALTLGLVYHPQHRAKRE